MNTVPFYDQILYDTAMKLYGKPYIWGGDDPMTGYDCSGLVIELMQSVGVFPRGNDTTAQGLFNYILDKGGRQVAGSQFGNLVFFGRSVTKITHIGFCLDQYRMLHAGGGGSGTVSEDVAKRVNAYARIDMVGYRGDCVGYVKPSYASIGYFG